MKDWPFELPKKTAGKHNGTLTSKWVGLTSIRTGEETFETEEQIAEFLAANKHLLKKLGKLCDEAIADWNAESALVSNVQVSSSSVGEIIAAETVSLKYSQVEFSFDVKKGVKPEDEDLIDSLRFGFAISIEMSTKNGFVEFVFQDHQDTSVEMT